MSQKCLETACPNKNTLTPVPNGNFWGDQNPKDKFITRKGVIFFKEGV
jgi:hypothetical protein